MTYHFVPIILYVWQSVRTFCNIIIIHNVHASCHMLNYSRDTLLQDLEPMSASVLKLAVATIYWLYIASVAD